MLAVYAKEPNVADPLASIVLGERPEPVIREGWVRVKVSHASLNRHDIFTLMGYTSHEEPIRYPMIMGNDGAGTLDDGTPVIIYPVMGSSDWHGDETLDPNWHIFSELMQGTMAEFVAIPRSNAIPRPEAISAEVASVLGTAWLTAYRALFTKSRLQPGATLLVQGASGGVSTALIQLARAAGIEVWVTGRTNDTREVAERLGAHRTFHLGEALPRRVDAVVDSVGAATLPHSLQWVRRGGTIITNGITTGAEVKVDLLRVFVEQITIAGTIMGTLDEMNALIRFIINAGIRPEIGAVVPMHVAKEAFHAMISGRTRGKTVFTI